MQKALITGISGQDGRLLAELLDKQGIHVTGTTRFSDQANIEQIQSVLPKNSKLISINTNNFTDWLNLLSSGKFDAIFHLAAQSSVGKSFLHPIENILSPTQVTYNLLEATRIHQPKSKVIIAGSTEVFGSHGKLAITETSQKKPMSPYALGKLNQNSVASFFKYCYDMHVSYAYLSNHESVYRGSQFVTMKIVRGAYDIFQKKQSNIKLGNLSVIRDWGWAPEFMSALILLSNLDQPQDVILATGVSISLLEFAEEVFKYFGLEFKEHVEYDANLLRSADPLEVHYNTSRAGLVLNWHADTKGLEVPKRLADAFSNKHE